MDEIKREEGKASEGSSKNWLIVFWIAIIGAVILWVLWVKKHVFRERLLKSELAQQYGVSTKILVNWVKQVGSDKLREKYAGNKSKKVLTDEFYIEFGHPDDWPQDLKGRRISNRKEITRALSIEQSTLNRRLREIELPVSTIGMSYQAFTKLKFFPPRQAALVIRYMESQGYPLR